MNSIPLSYRLVVMTNGRPCLRETLEAFRERVNPAPVELLIHDDGRCSEPYGGGTEWANVPVRIIGGREPVGFCAAVERTWRVAAELPGADYIFWLEDDEVIKRRVDLAELAKVLAAERHITQMSLMRQAVNSDEIAAGGCFNLRRELYEDRGDWLESRTNFSTGCSLIPRRVMLAHPWPSYPENCEGRYSIDLMAEGLAFGVWGGGEPWVEHVGIRSGFGY